MSARNAELKSELETEPEPVNRTIALLHEYVERWKRIDNPEYGAEDSAGLFGYERGVSRWLPLEQHDPSLAMHCLIEDGNVRDSDLAWEREHLGTPEFAAQFYPPFVADSLQFLRDMEDIPEEERTADIHQF